MTWSPIRLRRRHEEAVAADPIRPMCQAPFTSMYLDQRGWVRACCMNTTNTLGNIADASLVDIWNGERTRALRRAMEDQDLSQGCGFCRWQVEEGRRHLAFIRWFDDFNVTESDPRWPLQLEISISNTCNLQCVMCNGEWSSSIRSQREGLAPLPKVYDDRFFDDLRQFLPHLERVKFLGGEPFLATETLRVMELMVELGVRPECHVTTNGTQWSPRVERILEMLPIDIAVSLDAATAETYESIRVGSSWDTVQRNLDRFQEWARRHHRSVTLTYCLMTTNWHEFADFCLAADERGLGCTVNTVTQPDPLSLYHLPADELAEVVGQLEAMDDQQARRMTLSFSTWTGELERLRAHLADRQAGVRVMGVDTHPGEDLLPGRSVPHDAAHQAELDAEVAAIRAEALPAEAFRLRVDADDLVVEVSSTDAVLGVPVRKFKGQPLDRFTELVAAKWGAILNSVTLTDVEAARVLDVHYPGGRMMRVVLVPAIAEDGAADGLWLDLAWVAA